MSTIADMADTAAGPRDRVAAVTKREAEVDRGNS